MEKKVGLPLAHLGEKNRGTRMDYKSFASTPATPANQPDVVRRSTQHLSRSAGQAGPVGGRKAPACGGWLALSKNSHSPPCATGWLRFFLRLAKTEGKQSAEGVEVVLPISNAR
jgi:hypothetical protein